MPGSLHPNVVCTKCGGLVLMVFHTHGRGRVTFEYIHRDKAIPHDVIYPCWEGYIQEVLEDSEDPKERIKGFVYWFTLACMPQPPDPDGDAVMEAIETTPQGGYSEVIWNPPPRPEPPKGLIEAITRAVFTGGGDTAVRTAVLAVWRRMATRTEPAILEVSDAR